MNDPAKICKPGVSTSPSIKIFTGLFLSTYSCTSGSFTYSSYSLFNNMVNSNMVNPETYIFFILGKTAYPSPSITKLFFKSSAPFATSRESSSPGPKI